MQMAELVRSYERQGMEFPNFSLSIEEVKILGKAVFLYWQRFLQVRSSIQYADCLQDVLIHMISLKRKPVSLHNIARWTLYKEYFGHGGSTSKKTYFYSKTHNTMPVPLVLVGEDKQTGKWFEGLVSQFYQNWQFKNTLTDKEAQSLAENLWAVGGPKMYSDLERFLLGNPARSGTERKGKNPDVYDTTMVRRAVDILKKAFPTQADLLGDFPAVELSKAVVTNLIDYAKMTNRLNRIVVPHKRKYHRLYDIKHKNFIIGELITTPEHRAFLERQIMRGTVEKTGRNTWIVKMDNGRSGHFTSEKVALDWLKDQTVEELCLACGRPFPKGASHV